MKLGSKIHAKTFEIFASDYDALRSSEVNVTRPRNENDPTPLKYIVKTMQRGTILGTSKASLGKPRHHSELHNNNASCIRIYLYACTSTLTIAPFKYVMSLGILFSHKRMEHLFASTCSHVQFPVLVWEAMQQTPTQGLHPLAMQLAGLGFIQCSFQSNRSTFLPNWIAVYPVTNQTVRIVAHLKEKEFGYAIVFWTS